MIKIHNYEMLNFDSENIIISERGISKINSKPLWEALSDLKTITQTDITEDDLNEVIKKHNLPKTETNKFIKKIIKIRDKVEIKYFNELIIVHNTNDPNRLEENIELELSAKPKIVHSSDYSINTANTINPFIHFHCEQYDYESLKNTYFETARAFPRGAVSVSHFTGDSFSFSQPYIFEIGNPCHFCEIDRLCEYEEINSGMNSWVKLLRFGKQKKIPLYQKEHSSLQKNLALSMLSQRLNLYTENGANRRHQDSVFSAAKINLQTGRIIEENIPHWFLCKCLRGTL